MTSIAVNPSRPSFAPGLTPDVPPAPSPMTASPAQPETPIPALQQALGDQRNWQALAQPLNQAAQQLPGDADAGAVASALRGIFIKPDIDSSYALQTIARDGTGVDLERFLLKHGIPLPRSRAELLELAQAVEIRSVQHPYGNYGGGLSWPLPLSVSQQQAVRTLLSTHCEGVAALPYLTSAVALSEEELKDPGKALEKLIQSPRGQALGQAIQRQLNGIATPNSVSDYVLAAINLGLDPESISQPRRNTVAGFDLAQEQHWGKSPASIVNALSNHLRVTGKTTAATAGLGAHLLLARIAPQFLVKDLPANLTYGSQAWASLQLAVAKIEARTPGVTPQMSYAQVMSVAHEDPAPASDAIQTAVLLDWAVANGVLEKKHDSLYVSDEIERARTEFNQQLEERATALTQLRTPLPSLKQIALARLEQQFGQGIPFEEKCIQADYPFRSTRLFQGTYSMLDIAMMEHQDTPTWKTTDSRIPIDRLNKRQEINVFRSFRTEFDNAINLQQQGLRTTIKHMIAQLPLADRKNLEHGQVQFFQDRTYTIATDFLSPPALTSKSPRLLIKTLRDGATTVYEVDLVKGAITRGKISTKEFRTGNKLHKTEAFNPADGERLSRLNATTASASVPRSFSSARSQDIADGFVEAFDLGNADTLKQARGVTTFDEEKASRDKVHEFLLNLIPLRSAIVNFKQGNHDEGLIDLGLDVLGFVTAGAATSAKVGKVAATTWSGTTKALALARAVGVGAIDALNPLSGVGDLLMGAGRLVRFSAKGAAHKIQVLRGSADSYDLLAASRRYEGAATGTLKIADHSGEMLAVQHQGKWYAYDEAAQQAYGSPLETFTPSNTLMPVTRRATHRDGQRYAPLDRNWRLVYPRTPLPPKKPLPTEDYVLSTKGKWHGEHFASANARRDVSQKFESDMAAYYKSVRAGNLAARPPIPSIPEPKPSSEVITQALQASNGVIFGENHGEIASFQLLFDHVDLFVQQKVKRVYFEGVADYPSGVRDDGIGWLGDTEKKRDYPSFEELKAKFEKNGIEVLPLDHVYLTQRHTPPTHGKTLELAEATQRLARFNYYAAQTIKATSDGEKWIALVGRAHTNTQLGVPGMVELTGSLSIGVFPKRKAGPSVGSTNTVLVPPGQALAPQTPIGDLTIAHQVMRGQP